MYFEIQFPVQKLADGGANGGGDRVGSHSSINHLMIKSVSKIVCDIDNVHKVTFVKNLLEYSNDFSGSVAKNSLDTDTRIAKKYRI